MTEPTRRLAKSAVAGQTWERKRIRRLVLGHLAERMSALTRFVVCGAHVTIMPDECRRDVTAFIGSLALWICPDALENGRRVLGRHVAKDVKTYMSLTPEESQSEISRCETPEAPGSASQGLGRAKRWRGLLLMGWMVLTRAVQGCAAYAQSLASDFTSHYRSVRNAARISSENSCGCSHAA